MPLSKSGAFRANPQQARALDSIGSGMPKPKPLTRPGADAADQDPTAGDEPSITITKTADGFHYVDSTDPEGGDAASFEEVMQKAKECLGVEDQPEDAGGAAPMGGEEDETQGY